MVEVVAEGATGTDPAAVVLGFFVASGAGQDGNAGAGRTDGCPTVVSAGQ